MSRSYYALVAGLPDISVKSSRLEFLQKDFKQELVDLLDEDDYKLASILYYQFDNLNLISLLEKNEQKFDELANLSQTVLEEEVKTPTVVPRYMFDFIEDFNSGTESSDDISLTNRLNAAFFEQVSNHDNNFISKWFEFERNLKNVITALNCRRLDIDLEKELIGDDFVVEMIKKRNSGDFGLTGELPFLSRVLQLYDGGSVMDREYGIDMIKWDFLEELILFKNFSIDRVLAFVLQLRMAERWLKLDKEKGREILKNIMNQMKSGFEFSDDFSLSGGK